MILKSFADRIKAAFGPEGESWLISLPPTIQDKAADWSLTLEPPFKDMNYNYVAPAARADGSRAVLKIGVPNPELYSEIKALKLYDGKGIVKLLEVDLNAGAMLLERLDPGLPLFNLEDDERATRAACHVMRKLHKAGPAVNDDFPTIADWARGMERLRSEFEGGTGPFPRNLVERAESDLSGLMSSMGAPTLLHGDLHHWNILSSQREPWLAVDPKGLIGEPEYETGAWLRNPFPQILEWANPIETIKRRVDQFAAELSFDRQRVLAWGVYQAVLAAWWSYEEGGEDWKHGTAIADLIAAVK